VTSASSKLLPLLLHGWDVSGQDSTLTLDPHSGMAVELAAELDELASGDAELLAEKVLELLGAPLDSHSFESVRRLRFLEADEHSSSALSFVGQLDVRGEESLELALRDVSESGELVETHLPRPPLDVGDCLLRPHREAAGCHPFGDLGLRETGFVSDAAEIAADESVELGSPRAS